MQILSRLWNGRAKYYWAAGVLLLLAGLAAFALKLPYQFSGDGLVRYGFMDDLVHKGQITYMRYSMVGPLFSLPLWWLGEITRFAPLVYRYNLILLVIFALALYLWLRKDFDRTFLLIFILLLFFGSLFPDHLLNYYGEVFSAVCLGLGALALAKDQPWPGWVLAILAVWNTPALIAPFGLLILYQVWETLRLRYLALVPLVAVLLVGEAYLRAGSLTAVFSFYLSQDHGYVTLLPYSGRPGYSYPILLGIFSILFSFGKGLIFFCPGLLLTLWALRRAQNALERKILTLWLLILAGMILGYAPWWSWYGGWFWGPRFFLFASLPASWMLARLLRERQATLLGSLGALILLGVSVWVGVNGVVFQQKTLLLCKQNQYALEYLCMDVPEFSPLAQPFITPIPLSAQ